MIQSVADRAAMRQQLRDYLGSVLAFGYGRIAWLFVLVLAGSAVEAVGIVLLIPLLGLMFAGLAPGGGRLATLLRDVLGPLSPSVAIGMLLSMFVVLLGVRAIVTYQRDLRLFALSSDLVDAWRARLARAVAAAPWRRIQAVRYSRIEFALTSEVGRLSTGSDQILRGIIAAVQALILLAVALRLAPVLTGLALGTALIGVPLLVPVVRAAYRQGEALSVDGVRRHALFADFLAGMKLAKVHDAETRYVAEYLAISGRIRQRALAWLAVQTRSRAAFQVATGVGAAAVLLIGLTLTHTPAPELSALVVLLSRLVAPLQLLVAGSQAILTMLPAVGHLTALEAELDGGDGSDVARPTTADAPISRPAAVRLDALTYALPARDRTILRDASATIAAGELAVLMGPSGSGKTTLADIVMGLLEPDRGAVLIDDVPLDGHAVRSAFRRTVGYVPQDPFLFDDTIGANLSWAAPEADPAALWHALAQAEAADFVRALPDGLDTRVGNRGAALSGGERQRICLARALVRKPRLLVLDEATNALDRATEDRLFETLGHLRGTTTILTIAHRVPPGFPADRWWRIADGRLIDAR